MNSPLLQQIIFRFPSPLGEGVRRTDEAERAGVRASLPLKGGRWRGADYSFTPGPHLPALSGIPTFFLPEEEKKLTRELVLK